MKRFVEFDILRGVLLLMMVVDHSPSALRRFTDQPLGFFTTAECFVFVSAFLAGLIFRKREEKTGFGAACASSLQRARRIYLAHLFTICFAFTAGSLFLAQLPGLGNLLDHYLANPWAAMGGSLALVFRPPLMDILPMYVLFSLLTPGAFWVAKRWGWKTVLLLSFSVWVIAQMHVRDRVVTELRVLPFVQLGPFDLLAWQFLWVGGLFIGQRSIERKSLLPMPQVFRPLFLLLTIAFLFSRWGSLASGSATVTQTWLLDKWHLGPIRLINFCLAASVAAAVPETPGQLGGLFSTTAANWASHAAGLLQPDLSFRLAHRAHGVRLNRRANHVPLSDRPAIHGLPVCLAAGMAIGEPTIASPGPADTGQY